MPSLSNAAPTDQIQNGLRTSRPPVRPSRARLAAGAVTAAVLAATAGFAPREVPAADKPSGPAAGDKAAEPPFTENVQGDWFVILAQRHHQNLAETDPARHASRVRITADRLEWDAGGGAGPWLVAACRRAPVPEPTGEKQPPRDPNELLATTTGSDSPGDGVPRFARWNLTRDGILFICIGVTEQSWPTPNHRLGYHGWGSGTLMLILSRTAPPPLSKPDPETDAKALLGEWDILTELDDSMAKHTGRNHGILKFTNDRVVAGLPGMDPSMSGPYSLHPPQGHLGRIDIVITRHAGKTEFPLGRCPSLYAFCGPDLLLIVYPESGWRRDLPEADRRVPERLESNGDRNMWILRRSKGDAAGRDPSR
jgi:hypothetical protein